MVGCLLARPADKLLTDHLLDALYERRSAGRFPYTLSIPIRMARRIVRRARFLPVLSSRRGAGEYIRAWWRGLQAHLRGLRACAKSLKESCKTSDRMTHWYHDSHSAP